MHCMTTQITAVEKDNSHHHQEEFIQIIIVTIIILIITEATICVLFVILSWKPHIIFFITVLTLDNSGQILHHTGTYYQKHQIHLSPKDVLFGIFPEKCPLLDLLNYFIIIG